jgi:hypothetical protein
VAAFGRFWPVGGECSAADDTDRTDGHGFRIAAHTGVRRDDWGIPDFRLRAAPWPLPAGFGRWTGKEQRQAPGYEGRAGRAEWPEMAGFGRPWYGSRANRHGSAGASRSPSCTNRRLRYEPTACMKAVSSHPHTGKRYGQARTPKGRCGRSGRWAGKEQRAEGQAPGAREALPAAGSGRFWPPHGGRRPSGAGTRVALPWVALQFWSFEVPPMGVRLGTEFCAIRFLT